VVWKDGDTPRRAALVMGTTKDHDEPRTPGPNGQMRAAGLGQRTACATIVPRRLSQRFVRRSLTTPRRGVLVVPAVALRRSLTTPRRRGACCAGLRALSLAHHATSPAVLVRRLVAPRRRSLTTPRRGLCLRRCRRPRRGLRSAIEAVLASVGHDIADRPRRARRRCGGRAAVPHTMVSGADMNAQRTWPVWRA
jgi:hypothetical protein